MSSPENMELSIAQIANKIGFSTEHVIRLFKKNGMPSPNQVFTQIKLDYACELLASSDYKTIVISELIGINNVNYFNKLFKKHIGVSPIEYRKKEDFTSKQQKAEQ